MSLPGVGGCRRPVLVAVQVVQGIDAVVAPIEDVLGSFSTPPSDPRQILAARGTGMIPAKRGQWKNITLTVTMPQRVKNLSVRQTGRGIPIHRRLRQVVAPVACTRRDWREHHPSSSLRPFLPPFLARSLSSRALRRSLSSACSLDSWVLAHSCKSGHTHTPPLVNSLPMKR